MIGSILAQHAPLIRDYPGAPPPPPAPPAPPTPPNPPQSEPIAFSVVTLATLFGITGTAIASTTLATVTCADAAMTIVLSEAVPGLTFAYAAGVLTISGTPTTPTGMHRVVVSFMSSDGNYTVRGSSTHEITIVSASEVLTIGSMAGVSGRVGQNLGTQTLCTLTSNFDVDVTAAISGFVPNNTLGVSLPTLTFSWSKAGRAGALTTNPVTPSQKGTTAVLVTYSGNGQILGTSTHEVVIAAAYEPPAPAPAPTPAPSPPSPVPPPAPAPAPAPGKGPDPYFLQTKVLLHFDVLDPGGDPNNTGIRVSGRNDAPGQNWFNSPHCYQQVNPGLGYMQRFGYSPMAGGYFALEEGTRSRMEAGMAGISGNGAELTIECLADIHQVCWDAHRAPAGSINRFTPFITLMGVDGSLAWSIGIFSTSGISYSTADNRRVVMTAMVSRKSTTAPVDLLMGRYLLDRPAKFIHTAFQRTNAAGVQATAGWTDGAPSIDTNTWSGGFADPAGPVCRIGNHCPGLSSLAVLGGGSADSIPFVGALDEVRVTAAARYSAFINSTLPPVARVIPWPNY